MLAYGKNVNGENELLEALLSLSANYEDPCSNDWEKDDVMPSLQYFPSQQHKTQDTTEKRRDIIF